MISLYDAVVPTWRQILGGAKQFLQRGADHCADNNIDPADLVQARLFPDMFPLNLQVVLVHAHSIGAVEACRTGSFSPPRNTPPPADYAGCQKMIADALAGVEALQPDDVNALAGRDVQFVAGELKLPFITEGYLFSFAMPNFYFHATTAYDILRMKGVPLGKRDFMGTPTLKK
ncbi:MAG: DUF1993 domain-containing protein [Hyphomonadaceae bacterium]|nr:DUF1993 domain-containing protein [Hyphomonadaceae bacterium]